MSEPKRIRKRIDGLQRQIDLHDAKKLDEAEKPSPNLGKIEHWEKEIRAWQTEIYNLERRLRGRRRRGR